MSATSRTIRPSEGPMEITRRDMLSVGGKPVMIASVGTTFEQITGAEPPPDTYRMADHWWGMIIDLDKCIGCGNCVRACANENQVPKDYFRTWVERYEVPEGYVNPRGSSPQAPINGFPVSKQTSLKSFFVPKLCNHCADSPCVQGCPVGATFVSPGEVVLVDRA